MKGSGFPTAPIQASRLASPILWAAHWRLLLPGACCFSGSLDIYPPAKTSLALFIMQSAFRSKLVIVSVTYGTSKAAFVSILEVYATETFKKT